MLDAGWIWSLMTVLGPLVLAAGLIYGIVSYRKRDAAAKAHTEAATRKLYRQAARDERKSPPTQPR